jgi:SAM-dependent methyltransferase
MIPAGSCKVCGSERLRIEHHTAECLSCRVLLFYPYPDDRQLTQAVEAYATADQVRDWYAAAASRNHDNFTAMIRFAIPDFPTMRAFTALDYGGAGGQFACVLRSLYPNSEAFITDISDEGLQERWKPFNHQIRFADFPSNPQRFDVIFLNDVFEHVNDPIGVLRLLAAKLKPDGRIFIDTPRRSWLYPLLRAVSPALYRKLLRGTVDTQHLQLWSSRSISVAAERNGLAVSRYHELAEYTREADYYLKGIGASGPLIRIAGRVFHRLSGPLRAHNKIMAVLIRAAVSSGSYTLPPPRSISSMRQFSGASDA